MLKVAAVKVLKQLKTKVLSCTALCMGKNCKKGGFPEMCCSMRGGPCAASSHLLAQVLYGLAQLLNRRVTTIAGHNLHHLAFVDVNVNRNHRCLCFNRTARQ